jgi:hypothetical protein
VQRRGRLYGLVNDCGERRSDIDAGLTDVMNAIEPALEIVQLRSTEFTVCEEQLKSWLCLSRKRAIAAQPSTRR